uniref:Uncharacterized protein C16orf96-like isoform X1 n=1 Tax=Diabrotica virgifera virgifera TaxID=50390 RepID=A0A6P7GT08_DIAVI
MKLLFTLLYLAVLTARVHLTDVAKTEGKFALSDCIPPVDTGVCKGPKQRAFKEFTPKERASKEVIPKERASKEGTPKKVTPKEVTPKEVNPKEGEIHVWRYNVSSRNCVEDYGGCQATNNNNFQTFEECITVAEPICRRLYYL